MKHIIIAGGNGLVGSHLTSVLAENGHAIYSLQRSNTRTNPKVTISLWDIKSEVIDTQVFTDGCIVINLAGENIGAKRWTPARKNEILTSRLIANEILEKAIRTAKVKPSLIISASATGIYGSQARALPTEETQEASSDFLGETCRLWEQSSKQLGRLAQRHVVIRLGIVLSKDGGALTEMAKPIKKTFGVPVGSGKQAVPWIHISDLSRWITYIIEHDTIAGTFNTVADGTVTNAEFTKKLSEALQKPYFPLPVPAIFLKLFMGDMAILATGGVAVENKKIGQTGFQFRFARLQDAFNNIYSS